MFLFSKYIQVYICIANISLYGGNVNFHKLLPEKNEKFATVPQFTDKWF